MFHKITLIIFGLLLIIFAIFFASAIDNTQNNGTITSLENNIKKLIPYRFSKNKSSANRSQKVPILMYHYVRSVDKSTDPTGWSLSVTPENFALQLSYLKSQNYQTLSFEDIDYLIENKQNFPENPIILSFDDGYKDFYENAYPILKINNFSATVFMIGGKIDQDNYLSADQIKILDNYGIEFGLHTQTHINMANASDENIKKELAENSNILRSITSKYSNILAYPSGQFDQELIDLLGNSDIKYGLTTVEQNADFAVHNPLILPRLRVRGSTTLEKFKELLNNTNSYLIVPTTTTNQIQN